MPFYRSPDGRFDPDEAGFHPDDVPRAIVAFGADMATSGLGMGVHSHRRAQLVLSLRGVVTCEAAAGVWIVPPHGALWIPGGLPHSMTVSGHVEIYLLLIEPDAAPALPLHCSTLAISPLLKHLVLQVAHLPVLYDVDGADGRLVAVLLDQLAATPLEKMNFPMPADARLRTIAAAMMANPADRATIEDWGRRVAMAPRTLTRILQRETGMSFGRWRQQLHILLALRRLAEGASVQTVALDLGYEGSSAFVTMFRKAMGKPPARYLADRRGDA